MRCAPYRIFSLQMSVMSSGSSYWQDGGPTVRRSIQRHGGEKVQGLRRELDKLHHEAKSKVKEGVGVGGGVTLWPAMDDMRLSREEVWKLAVLSVSLIVCTFAIFHMYHGIHISKLRDYAGKLETFPRAHSLLRQTSDQELFREQLLSWHQDFLQLQKSIREDFDVVWSETTSSSNIILALYIVGIVTLLYFLVDNMFSKSRLTPWRIKVWVSLLCVVTTWTVLAVRLLVSAHRVETATRHVILSLNEDLAVLVQSSLDLRLYHSISLYWRSCCLPPSGSGVLSVLGLVPVQDLTYYLQYYSLPVLTAICTPIIKLLMSLRTVYSR